MYEQARTLFDAMPRDALTEGYAVLCAVKMRTDDYPERFDDYRLRYPASILSGKLHFEHGRILFDAGKYRQAATEFGFVSMDDLQEDELPEYIFKCGYSAFALGRYAEATRFFSLLESLPQSDYTPSARYFSGVMLYEDKEFGQSNSTRIVGVPIAPCSKVVAIVGCSDDCLL